MIFSTNIEKSFDKIQHPFMIKKNSHQSVCRKSISQLNKDHHDRFIANVILNSEKLRLLSQLRRQSKDSHFCHFYLKMYWKS